MNRKPGPTSHPDLTDDLLRATEKHYEPSAVIDRTRLLRLALQFQRPCNVRATGVPSADAICCAVASDAAFERDLQKQTRSKRHSEPSLLISLGATANPFGFFTAGKNRFILDGAYIRGIHDQTDP